MDQLTWIKKKIIIIEKELSVLEFPEPFPLLRPPAFNRIIFFAFCFGNLFRTKSRRGEKYGDFFIVFIFFERLRRIKREMTIEKMNMTF